MPFDTPPCRVKKAWRTPGRSSSGEVRTGRSAMGSLRASKPGGVQLGAVEAGDLEQLAHLVAADQTIELAVDDLGPVGPGAHQGLGALADPQPAQEGGLGEDRAWPRRRRSGRPPAPREVGMDGQVGLAGEGQRIDLLMPAQGLQGVAEARARPRP